MLAGHLFHIDFGYIFGSDPKPLPPPMKLCKEMVEGMGGKDSPHYAQFQELCGEAFNILRKECNLIMSLLILMADASIRDINGSEKNRKIDPMFTLRKVCPLPLLIPSVRLSPCSTLLCSFGLHVLRLRSISSGTVRRYFSVNHSSKVQAKFQMELSSSEAIAHFQGLIQESVQAMFPQITDTLHRWVQYWRK